MEVVALNFEHSPTFGPLPDKYIRKITSTLALDLPLELVGTVGGQFSLQLVSSADWHLRVREPVHQLGRCVFQRGSTYQGTGSTALPECAPACRRSLLLTRTTGNGGATRGGRVLRWVPAAVAAAAAQLDSRGTFRVPCNSPPSVHTVAYTPTMHTRLRSRRHMGTHTSRCTLSVTSRTPSSSEWSCVSRWRSEMEHVASRHSARAAHIRTRCRN